MTTTVKKVLATVPLKFRGIFTKYIDMDDANKPANERKYVALDISGFEKDEEGDTSPIKALSLYFNFGNNTAIDALTIFAFDFDNELPFNSTGDKVSDLESAQEKLTAKLVNLRKTGHYDKAVISEKIPKHIQEEANRLIAAGVPLKTILIHSTYAVLSFAENASARIDLGWSFLHSSDSDS